MSSIYIRTLKRAEHTVFNVADGQKTYYDQQFGRAIPFSSGQQVKRSLIDSFCDHLAITPSPTTFLFDVDKQKKLKEGEVYGTCDPSYPDQLFGGFDLDGDDVFQKGNEACCFSLIRKVEIHTIPISFNTQTPSVSSMFQNQLLQIQESSLVTNTLSHLHQRFPRTLSKLSLAFNALLISHSEIDCEGLLQNCPLLNFSLDSQTDF